MQQMLYEQNDDLRERAEILRSYLFCALIYLIRNEISGNDNQDIVSMGTNSALLCRRVIDNAFQVMAIHYMALAQATDCLQLADRLSPASRKAYDDIRRIMPPITDDKPLYGNIAAIEHYLRTNLLKYNLL